MKINSQHLEAFYAIAKTLNFTKAAVEVHVTQSALSQRIAKLEEDLETTLFIRDRNSIQLTEQAYLLLRYCETHYLAEAELLEQLKGSEKGFSGILRIAGFSSVMRSLVMPALADLARQHENLSFIYMTKEIRELEDLLRRSEVDYIITSKQSESPDIESLFLGFEENILVKSTKHESEFFLDHDSHDETTKAYFRQNKVSFKPTQMRYMDDVYGLIEGVKLGYGKAILPKHLIENEKDLKILDPKRLLKVSVYLSYFKQPYYRKVHGAVLNSLILYFKKNLAAMRP